MENYVKSLEINDEEKSNLSILISAACRYWNRKSFADETFYDSAQRKAFEDRMTQLNKDNIVRACFVRGDLSLDRKDIVLNELLRYFGISGAEEIISKTGDFHWHIAYKPKDSLVLVDSRMQKKVLTYTF